MTEEMKAIAKELQGGRTMRECLEFQLALQADWSARMKAHMHKSESRLSIPLPVVAIITGLIAVLIQLYA